MLTYSNNNLSMFAITLQLAATYIRDVEIPKLEQELAELQLQSIPALSLFERVKGIFGFAKESTHDLEIDNLSDKVRLMNKILQQFEVMARACSNSKFTASSIEVHEDVAFLAYHFALLASVK